MTERNPDVVLLSKIAADPDRADSLLTDRAAVLASTGHIECGSPSRQSPGSTAPATTQAWLTDLGRATAATVTPAMLTGEPASPAMSARAALWLWLFRHGSDPTATKMHAWADPDPWGANGEGFHLADCGLDLERSTPVLDDVWQSWGGTFHANDNVVGVSGAATCNCGAVNDYTLRAKVSSMTDLVIQIVSGA